MRIGERERGGGERGGGWERERKERETDRQIESERIIHDTYANTDGRPHIHVLSQPDIGLNIYIIIKL